MLIMALLLFTTKMSAQDCQNPSAAKLDEIATYLTRRATVSTGATAAPGYRLSASEHVSDTCYWKLTYTQSTTNKTISLILLPGQTFIAPTIFDLRVDPVAADMEQKKSINAILSGAKGPSRGSQDAPVLLVEFGDFQCPYCKRLHDALKESDIPSQRIRLVFHSYPLASHPWALPAAQIAACVAEQSSDSFWDMQDYIFDHQQEISPTNVEHTLLDYVGTMKSVDSVRVQTCLDSGVGKKLVDDDIALGKQVGVAVTPTLYVNGQQIRGTLGPQQLKAVIQGADNVPGR